MFLWDARTDKAVASVFGPCISGESLDVKNNLVLSGSYRDKEPLELYDLRNFKKLCEIETQTKLGDRLNYVSNCQFGKNKNNENYIIAGSCMNNNVVIFKKDLVYKADVVASYIGNAVYSCGFANTENKFYYGTSEGRFNIYHFFNM